MNAVFSFARLGALLIKEFIQMRRDRITFAMMLGVPLMQLVLFGFAINNDPKSLPAALVATSSDPYTRAMVSALQTTGYYRFDHVAQSAAEAEFLMARGDVSAVAGWAPPDVVDALQKLCHDLLATGAGAAPRFFAAADLPRGASARALSAWSRELMQAARTAEHPFHAGLMLESLVSRARSALDSKA